MGKSEQSKKNKREKIKKEAEKLQSVCIYEGWEQRELFLNAKNRFAPERSKHAVYSDIKRFFKYKVIPKYVISLMILIASEMKENTKKQEQREEIKNEKVVCNRVYRNYDKVYNNIMR